MAFSDLVAAADNVVTNALCDLPVTLHFTSTARPPGTYPDAAIIALTKNPSMEEDYAPGTAQPQGVAVLYLWTRIANLSTTPIKGDTATANGVDYDIYQVDADREGGGTLRCRRRVQGYQA